MTSALRWALAPAVPTPAPDQWVYRVPLTLAVLGVAVYVYVLMRRGWRARSARQESLPALPTPPAEGGAELLPELDGLYVGTAVAGEWLERVTARGLGRRGRGVLVLTAEGLEVHRDGEPSFAVPAAAVRGARVDARLVGKVAGPGGLLVITWAHGDALLDTGFRADDRDAHPLWARSLTHLVTTPARPPEETP